MQTLDLFSSSPGQDRDTSECVDVAKQYHLRNADLLLYPQFFPSAEADTMMDALLGELAWQQDDIELYGKTHKVPRLSCWYGEPNLRYSYSGISAKALPWTPLLRQIKNRVNTLLGVQANSSARFDKAPDFKGKPYFNSVLCNLYRNGDDGVAWHADDEAELGEQPIIASLSFGALRQFQLKHRYQPALRHSMQLPHGSVLLMQGQTQSHWLHQLAKSKKPLLPRINLTFRRIV